MLRINKSEKTLAILYFGYFIYLFHFQECHNFAKNFQWFKLEYFKFGEKKTCSLAVCNATCSYFNF